MKVVNIDTLTIQGILKNLFENYNNKFHDQIDQIFLFLMHHHKEQIEKYLLRFIKTKNQTKIITSLKIIHFIIKNYTYNDKASIKLIMARIKTLLTNKNSKIKELCVEIYENLFKYIKDDFSVL